MRPKKRDQQVLEEPKSQLDQAQADHELFLQAFEKPTQIYRYLRTRNLISPIFLHRSLSYMRERCSRKANTRENFKVDGILKRVESERKKDLQDDSYKSQYMNLMFTGFFDEGSDSTKSVDVETILKKVSHKKRKDATSPVTDAVVGKVSVSCNPVGSPSTSDEVVSVSGDRFQHSHGTAVRSYELLIRVTRKYFRSIVLSQPLTNGTCDSDDADVDIRPLKRRRSNRISDEDHEEEVTSPPAVKREEVTTVYTAQLVVYDQHLHRLLTDGDYEVVLQEQCDHVTGGGKSRASWETISGNCESGAFDVFHKCPTLKFRLAWGRTALQGTGDCTALFPASRYNHIDQLDLVNNHITSDHSPVNGRRGDHSSSVSVERRAAGGGCTASARDGARRKRVFYQFLYNKNTRRQTEARDNNQCPWCGIDCRQLYSLMRHLRSCHPRFNFTYAEHQKGARIDVSVNESYDGSYAGNPQDIRSYIGYAFSRNGPVRRTPVTYIFVYKPQRSNNSDMFEFADEESEAPATRQIMQGHDRLYYHPVTCQPVRPCEIEVASVDKNDPEWLRQKTIHLLEDFTDVNEGEKEVMKMWNLHIMNHNFIGDCSLPKACATFVQEYGEAIIHKNLFHNFLLHITNLFDFGLVRPDTVTRTMMQLYWLQHRLATETQPTGKSDAKPQVNGFSESSACSDSS